MSGETQEPSDESVLRTLATVWPRDLKFLEALHESWISQYADYIGEASAKALVSRLLDADELYPDNEKAVQLAMVGNELAGVAVCRSMQGLSLITMLEVLEAYRHQGVGRQLLSDLQASTDERLFAHVSIHRPLVLRFYENQDFVKLPRTRVDHYGYRLEFDVVVK